MSDTAQKIAEIREWHEGKRDSFPQFTVFEAVGVMLDEIDRIEREYAEERAAHNAHVTELCELEQERDKLIEVLRKLSKTNAENISEIREWKAKQNDPEMTDLDWYNYVARDILKEIGVTLND